MKFSLLFFTILFLAEISFSQQWKFQVPSPEINSFAGTLYFLSSDRMEGRGSGTNGAFLAGEYIVSTMQNSGLQPYLQQTFLNPYDPSRYFQEFNLINYVAGESKLAISDKEEISLKQNRDFVVDPGIENINLQESSIIFAAYGLCLSNPVYDDFKNLDIKEKIVVVMDGFPGWQDTVSPSWQKMFKHIHEDSVSIYKKRKDAEKKGALALLVITQEDNLTVEDSLQNALNHQLFDLPSYYLPGDKNVEKIPIIRISRSTANRLFSGSGIDFTDYEKRASQSFTPLKNVKQSLKSVGISVPVVLDTIEVRNVIGVIKGMDTTKAVVIGAHYDHLGKNFGQIYNGSDDNASGVAGMLALARLWSESGIQPPCNLIFAAWAAEEIGLFGSQYFAENFSQNENILLYLNMDMISRSAREDTSCRELSVGTRNSDFYLKEITLKNNLKISPPFKLDLWDVTGHSGSDYASFTSQNIPVMTFFSGYHSDYHTPQDDFSKADLLKMENILDLVNCCLKEFLQNQIAE